MARVGIKSRAFEKEINFIFSKSGGKGGQHVNKTETKATLLFSINDSQLLREAEKKTILNKLKSRISTEGILIISDESSRSQHTNKENAIKKFLALISKALQKKKVRKATAPTYASVKERMKEKKRIKEIKQMRRKSAFD